MTIQLRQTLRRVFLTVALLTAGRGVAAAQETSPVPVSREAEHAAETPPTEAVPDAGAPATRTPSPSGSTETPRGAPAMPEITPGPEMTLAQALTAAADRNLSLAAARIEIEKADAVLSTAWGAVFPIVSGKMEFMHRDHEDTFDVGDMAGAMGFDIPASVVVPLNDLKGSLLASVPLINFPAWHSISSAKRGVSLARLSLEAVERQQLLAVAQAYYMALMARELIDLHISTIESASHHLEVAKAKLDAGAGLRIDVIRAETDLDQARQELLNAHLAFDKARDAVALLTGSENLPLPVAVNPMDAPSETDDSLVKDALGNRPEVAINRLQVEMANLERDGVWKQFLPTLSAAWQGTYQFTEPGDLGSSDRSRWIAILTLSIPLYDQMRYGNLDLKRAQIRQATIKKEDIERQVSLEVRNARRDYLTSLTSVEIADRRAALSVEAMALSEAAFEAGTGSSLDVTESRRRTSSANVDLASKRLQSQLTLLKLLNAIGVDLIGATE